MRFQSPQTASIRPLPLELSGAYREAQCWSALLRWLFQTQSHPLPVAPLRWSVNSINGDSQGRDRRVSALALWKRGVSVATECA